MMMRKGWPGKALVPAVETLQGLVVPPHHAVGEGHPLVGGKPRRVDLQGSVERGHGLFRLSGRHVGIAQAVVGIRLPGAQRRIGLQRPDRFGIAPLVEKSVREVVVEGTRRRNRLDPALQRGDGARGIPLDAALERGQVAVSVRFVRVASDQGLQELACLLVILTPTGVRGLEVQPLPLGQPVLELERLVEILGTPARPR